WLLAIQQIEGFPNTHRQLRLCHPERGRTPESKDLYKLSRQKCRSKFCNEIRLAGLITLQNPEGRTSVTILGVLRFGRSPSLRMLQQLLFKPVTECAARRRSICIRQN